MDSNLSLKIGFKGQLKLNAQAMPLQEGYLKLGGIVDDSLTNGLKFGVVCSSDPDSPEILKAGHAVSTDIVRGVVVFDDAVAQNAPAHPDRYLAGFPCAAVNHGFVWLEGWTKAGTGAIDPKIGCKVVCSTATGAIEFIASSAEAGEGYEVLAGASVRSVTEQGALLYLD